MEISIDIDSLVGLSVIEKREEPFQKVFVIFNENEKELFYKVLINRIIIPYPYVKMISISDVFYNYDLTKNNLDKRIIFHLSTSSLVRKMYERRDFNQFVKGYPFDNYSFYRRSTFEEYIGYKNHSV